MIIHLSKQKYLNFCLIVINYHICKSILNYFINIIKAKVQLKIHIISFYVKHLDQMQMKILIEEQDQAKIKSYS